jgi:hypothetical protein
VIVTAKPTPAVPEALQHLHGLMALSLANEHRFAGKDALVVAAACLEAITRSAGGPVPDPPADDGAPRHVVKPARRHENVELLHNAINLAIMRKAVRIGALPASELADDVCLELQRTFGGVGGFYLPVPVPLGHVREERNARIRRLAGPGPHRSALIKKIAREVRCSVSTVWRAILSEGKDGQ